MFLKLNLIKYHLKYILNHNIIQNMFLKLNLIKYHPKYYLKHIFKAYLNKISSKTYF